MRLLVKFLVLVLIVTLGFVSFTVFVDGIDLRAAVSINLPNGEKAIFYSGAGVLRAAPVKFNLKVIQ